MNTKINRLRTVLFFVLANLFISSSIFAQVKTSTKKLQIDPVKKKEISAKKEMINKNLLKLPVVGDFAQGGIVFWVDETGKNGLVCAKSDQSSGIVWFAGTIGNTGATADGPYTGEANTAKIIEAQGAVGNEYDTYAALICYDLKITEGGKTYDDWYLPSRQEYKLMYANRTTINTTATSNGGAAFGNSPSSYWSSTEANNGSAWTLTFYNGDQARPNKDNKYRVRAIRAFHR